MMLMEVLTKWIAMSLLGFVISSMMAISVGLTIGQIIGALRNARLVLLMLVANFVAAIVAGRFPARPAQSEGDASRLRARRLPRLRLAPLP